MAGVSSHELGSQGHHSHSIINKPPEPAWLKGFVVIAMKPYRHFYRQSRRAFADAGDRSICRATVLAAPSSISPHIIRTLPPRRARTCRRRIRGRGVTRLQSHLRHSRLTDYAQELTEETTSIPPHLTMYIDYRAMARDMEYSGDLFTLETGFEQVHVFWNR